MSNSTTNTKTLSSIMKTARRRHYEKIKYKVRTFVKLGLFANFAVDLKYSKEYIRFFDSLLRIYKAGVIQSINISQAFSEEEKRIYTNHWSELNRKGQHTFKTFEALITYVSMKPFISLDEIKLRTGFLTYKEVIEFLNKSNFSIVPVFGSRKVFVCKKDWYLDNYDYMHQRLSQRSIECSKIYNFIKLYNQGTVDKCRVLFSATIKSKSKYLAMVWGSKDGPIFYPEWEDEGFYIRNLHTSEHNNNLYGIRNIDESTVFLLREFGSLEECTGEMVEIIKEQSSARPIVHVAFWDCKDSSCSVNRMTCVAPTFFGLKFNKLFIDHFNLKNDHNILCNMLKEKYKLFFKCLLYYLF